MPKLIGLWILVFLIFRRVHSFVISTRKHSYSPCSLNRILFFDYELDQIPIFTDNGDACTNANVTLDHDDYRAKHVQQILKLNDGDTIRTGVVSCDRFPDGLSTDTSTIYWTNHTSLTICLNHLAPPSLPESPVSLILALPRPLQLSRILPMVSQMGVQHLVLSDARKVPKDYFGSHLLRIPQELTDRLVEGLTQSGDVRLPKIHVARNVRQFLDNDLDLLFPPDEYVRLVAHPSEESIPMKQVEFGIATKCVIAIGPEGGWEEEREINIIQNRGFHAISLGSRILRTDCAVVGILALAHDRLND